MKGLYEVKQDQRVIRGHTRLKGEKGYRLICLFTFNFTQSTVLFGENRGIDIVTGRFNPSRVKVQDVSFGALALGVNLQTIFGGYVCSSSGFT